ncbi:MAG TPA: RraA family protein [Thermoanaerobaculia bacterium]|nr:RraA family protein [Thermoanaerobaculia bacterium]
MPITDLTTPLLADAALRRDALLRFAPPGIRSLTGAKIAGRALPVRHCGSVDVFLEAMIAADRGDVLVIDNGGRMDEACAGDLTALEAQAHGIGGIVIWGVHRDSAELHDIGLPMFSYGAWPCGPVRLDPRPADALTSARFGDFTVTRDHFVFGDEDGLLFLAAADVESLIETANEISRRERAQAERVRKGTTLADQFHLREYLAARERNPQLTFRAHLRSLAAEIEV